MDIGFGPEPPDDSGPADTDDAAYIERVIAGIQEWRSRAPSVFGSITGVVFKPFGWVIGKVIPPSAIMGVLNGADWAASQTLTAAKYPGYTEIRECDVGAGQVRAFHVALAAGEGGAAGFIGLPAMIVDVPAVVALAMRLVRQTGVEYGYSDADKFERQFVFQVLAAASANTMAEKAGAVLGLEKMTTLLAKTTWKAMGEKAASNAFGMEAGIVAVRSLAKELGIDLTKRKALEVLPVVGAVVGAATNGMFIHDVGIAAQVAYQERWLRDRGFLVDGE